MLSVLLDTEACYMIKKNDKKIILPRQAIILLAQITILPTQIEKSLFRVGIFLLRQKKSELQGSSFFIILYIF